MFTSPVLGNFITMSIGAEHQDGLTDLRSMHVRLAPTLDATTTARQLVETACRDWQVEHVRDVAQLVITELVSNVLRHAGTDMDVVVSLRTGFLRLAVRDGSTALPRLGTPGDTVSEAGRGLLVIEALCAEWGTAPNSGGKVVWALLPLAADEQQ
jgi:anti-sigma regulatory factor (Ser/Thr protein kinase)